MKKSLVALAVLAASGAAMAQSTVTLYGIADIWMGSVKVKAGSVPVSAATANALAGTTTTLMNSGGVNGSRWGLKGSEDLGGGLKANFDLQSGFNLDTGAAGQGGLLFGRQSWVGVSGGFGAVRAGRIGTPYYDIDGAADAVFDSALSPEQVVFRSYSAAGDTAFEKGNATPRINNSLRYDSPNMSGFTGAFQYSLGENKTTTVGAGSSSSLSLAYAGGPVAVSFGYQSEKANGNAKSINNTRLNAAYNLGVVTLKGSFGKAANVGGKDGADATEYQFGVDYPVSAALTLSGSFATSKDNSTLDAKEGKRTAFGLGAAYSLSKRTFVYGGYVDGKKIQTGATSDTTIGALVAGVQHRF